jgi:hypothetical protein
LRNAWRPEFQKFCRLCTKKSELSVSLDLCPRKFFYVRKNLQQNQYGSSAIEDYATEGSAEDMWSGYDGKQQGDPDKLGNVLVKIACMENPPKQFLAGSDALSAFTPKLNARLEEVHAYEDLSWSTDGYF